MGAGERLYAGAVLLSDKITEIAVLELPYRRKATIRHVEFDGGLKMVRLVLREGTRITQVDLDENAATELAEALVAAARAL